MIVAFRRTWEDPSPLHINGITVERVWITKFLLVFTWLKTFPGLSASEPKRAQHHPHLLQRPNRVELPPPTLNTFCRGVIESVLFSLLSVWYRNCAVSNHKTLRQMVRTAEKFIGVFLTMTDTWFNWCKLPALQMAPLTYCMDFLPYCHLAESTRASAVSPPDQFLCQSDYLLNHLLSPRALLGKSKPYFLFMRLFQGSTLV